MTREEQVWEDDETSVTDSRLDVKAIPRRAQPVHSGVASKKPRKRTSSWDPKEDDALELGESMTDVAPPGVAVASPQERVGPRRQRSENPTEPQFVDPLVGRVLAKKYRVSRHIASGGMGSVYEAEHMVLGHRVAVKVLHTHLVKKAESTKRFLNEAKVAANLDHPNVVRAVDVDETADGVPFFVLEYLDGQPLSAVLGRGRHLPLRRTLQIIMQVLSALEAAHEKGIVHRDIKPENIFLLKRSGDQEHVKVLDFGIAKISAATRATSQGKVFGTPMYMSPEQLKDSSNVDERTDIYAVGILLYEMLAGTVPFAAEGLAELMMATVTAEPTPLDTIRTDLPEGLSDLVRVSFAASRDERPPTVATLRHELSLFLTAATHMELERVALDPEAGTLDPDAVREIKAWRHKRASATRSKQPTWLVAAAALCLCGAGAAGGFAISSFLSSSAETVAAQPIEPEASPDVTTAAAFEPTAVGGSVAIPPLPIVISNPNQEGSTEQDGDGVAEEELIDDPEGEGETAEGETAESDAERATAERARRRRAASRRSTRRRVKRKEPESSGLGFQDSF